jgi:hypothetical protein
MSDQPWGKAPWIEPPVVRHEVEPQVKIERPPETQVKQVLAPPVPGQAQSGPNAAVDNPQAADEVWRQMNAGDALAVDQPAWDFMAFSEVTMALYFLHALHFQGKPGYEHLVGHDRAIGRPEDEEDCDAGPRLGDGVQGS